MKQMVSRMAVQAVGMLLLGASLWAQEVIVTDPAWFETGTPPADVPPKFKSRPRPTFPKELRGENEQGYVMVFQYVASNGDRSSVDTWSTHPYFSAFERGSKLGISPALQGTSPVDSVSWYAVIFNPREATQGGAEATPRLLHVTPVMVSKKELEPFGTERLAVPATVKLDADGNPLGVAVRQSKHDRFLRPIEAALTRWKFSPGRHGGDAVPAELLTVFLVTSGWDQKTKGHEVPAKTISRVQPVYPLALRRSGNTGEVLVGFVVDEKGQVRDAAVKRSNHPAFEEPALEAVRKWKFKPATKDGKPVQSKVMVPIVFNLDGGPAREGAMEVRGAGKQTGLPEQYRYDVPPKPKGVLYPVYPYELLEARTSGKAKVGLYVDERGRVSNVVVAEATEPAFGHALMAAVAAFEFVPALRDGKPVPTILRMEHEFNPGGWDGKPSAEDIEMLSIVKKHPERIRAMKELDAPLKPISRRVPVFPAMASTPEGKALVEILVDSDGRARLPRVLSASDPLFGYAAAQAAAEWHFEVPKIAGKPGIVRVRVPFEFKADEPAKKRDALSAAGAAEAK
jgi:TonB family protein